MKKRISKILIIIIYFCISLYVIDFSVRGNIREFTLKSNHLFYSNAKTIEIPKIKLSVSISKANDDFSNLDHGLVYYKNFNPNNKIIIFGHSGMGIGTFFNRLDELCYGDIVYLQYNKIMYEYSVIKTYMVSKKDVYILKEEFNSNKLLLITCVKGNKNKRFIVELGLKNVQSIEK